MDAINKGYTNLNLCLGGTSTVGYGLGAAQALGVKFYNRCGEIMDKPLIPNDYINIGKIKWIEDIYKEINFNVINDGITKACDLDNVNQLKIGKYFENQKENILKELQIVQNTVLQLTGLQSTVPYSGNAGGILYGIEQIFKLHHYSGGEYFNKLFHIEDMIRKNELIITGEGRYDNPYLQKIPVKIMQLAKQYRKRTLFICGQADGKCAQDLEEQKKYGIDQLISCSDYYNEYINNRIFSDEIEKYSEMTPIVLKDQLEKIGL